MYSEYVKKPRNKFFIRLDNGGEISWFCRKWIVEGRDKTGYRYCSVFETEKEAQDWVEYLSKFMPVK